jgi:hypothetical protein
MHKYYLEFILNMQAVSLEALKNSLIEFGENLEISQLSQNNTKGKPRPFCYEGPPNSEKGRGKDFKIRISTEDPTIIFDTCAQFGRLRSIKIDEKH